MLFESTRVLFNFGNFRNCFVVIFYTFKFEQEFANEVKTETGVDSKSKKVEETKKEVEKMIKETRFLQTNLEKISNIDDDDEEAIIQITKNFQSYMEDESPGFDFAACDCLPACSSIHYAAEMTQSEVETNLYLKANKFFGNVFDEYEKFMNIVLFSLIYFSIR